MLNKHLADNSLLTDEDLDTIFSRFGTIVSCEVIRDKRTRESLQYAFIEFENQKDCEQAYFKMQGVLIDDHRIHVDFSQSVSQIWKLHHSDANNSQVSRLSDKWRTATNSKRAQIGGGFGGIATLEKKRQFRALNPKGDDDRRQSSGHSMVFEKDVMRHRKDRDLNAQGSASEHPRSRSRSPGEHHRHRNRTPPMASRKGENRSDAYRRDNYNDRNRRR